MRGHCLVTKQWPQFPYVLLEHTTILSVKTAIGDAELHSVGLGREVSAAALSPIVTCLIHCPVADLAQIFIITL